MCICILLCCIINRFGLIVSKVIDRLCITSMGVGQINASVILNFRIRSPRNNEPENSSAQTQSYEMTRGLSQTGVGMNSSTVPDSGEYEKTVPDSGEYDSPEPKNHYGRWNVCTILVILCLYYPGITIFASSLYYYVCIILVILCLYYPGSTMFVLLILLCFPH